MGQKDRQLFVANLGPSSDINALRALFEHHGPVQNCFIQPGASVRNNATKNVGRVTFKNEKDANIACEALNGMQFEGKRLRITLANNKKPTTNGHGSVGGNNRASSVQSPSTAINLNSEAPRDSALPPPIAPAPRDFASTPIASAHSIDAAGNLASDGSTNGNNVNSGAMNNNGVSTWITPRDTWEASLEDSDYDDGFVPHVPSRKPKPVEGREWTEAYSLVKDFAKHGGAILAVDVESWDQDHDYIIEVGMAHVSWQAGNGTAPKVRAEHIIVEDNENKRNGTYSPDARDRFAFGKSRRLSEDNTNVYLRFLIDKYSKTSPLILLFHNASAEKQYFELMNIDLADYREAIPARLLYMNPRTNRADKIILDTQRLYTAFHMLEEEGKKGQPQLGLGNICKKVGIPTKHLHNAGNDALYTLKLFMKLAEKELAKSIQSAQAATAET